MTTLMMTASSFKNPHYLRNMQKKINFTPQLQKCIWKEDIQKNCAQINLTLWSDYYENQGKTGIEKKFEKWLTAVEIYILLVTYGPYLRIPKSANWGYNDTKKYSVNFRGPLGLQKNLKT